MPSLTHDGHTLTWEEHSTGNHTFIFIHGYSASQRSWQSQLELFKPRGRCVTLDLPGHFPAKVPMDYKQLTQEQMLDMETRAIEQIADGRPVTLIGHSTGGLVAVAVASRLPELVKRVVSVDAVVWGPLTRLLALAHWEMRNHLYPLFRLEWGFTQIAPWAMMIGISFYAHDKIALFRNPIAWDLCKYSHSWYRQQSLWNLAVLINFLETCDIRPLVSSIRAPVLVMTGDRDPVVPPQQAHWLAENLPNADLHVFHSTGHMPFLEQAEEWNRVTLEWLDNHEVVDSLELSINNKSV